MAFPAYFIERLRGQFSLPELIGKRMPLRKSGREWVGCCPFHGEKTPSFRVYTDHYHCYGCGVHGDAVEFVKQFDRLSYKEAVEKLAREAGMELPEQSPQQTAKAKQQQNLYQVMEEAARYFERELLGARGLVARQYIEKRGITDAMLKHFRIGYAPDMRDGLKRALAQKNITEAQMMEAGLIAKSDQGSTYDRFRGRLIFPILDVQGRVIAFGGRILATGPDVKAAKYLNSPETPLFKKGENIYHFHHAGKVARQTGEIILAEGYMDVVALMQAGVECAAAPLGTAITPEQLKRLWTVCDAPLLCLDGDTAGMRASLRVAQMCMPLLTPGKTLKFIALPKGEDPDSLIAKRGVAAFEQCKQQARELQEVLWDALRAEYKGTTPAVLAHLEKQLTELADTIQDQTTRNHFRKYFREKIWQKPGKGKQAEEVKTLLRSPEQMGLIRQILALFIVQPVLLQDAEMEEVLLRLECAHVQEEQVRGMLIQAALEEVAPEDFSQFIAQQEMELLIADLIKQEGVAIPKEAQVDPIKARKWLDNLQGAYHISLLEAEYAALQEALHGGNLEADYERLMALQQELMGLRRQRAHTLITYGQ